MKAILFDLDETLILDEPVTERAFMAAAELAVQRYPLDPHGLIAVARDTAQKLWRQGPAFGYCDRIGHSAFEGLWATYSQSQPDLQTLAHWVPTFKAEVWRTALATQGILDEDLVQALIELWTAKRQSYPWYPETEALLQALQGRYVLGIVTNGVPDLQRQKLLGSSLQERFGAIAVSGEVNIGKPHRGICDWICQKLAVEPQDCVMVGDNAERDVAGGYIAGMKTVWVDRGYKPKGQHQAHLELSNMLDMLPWLERQ